MTDDDVTAVVAKLAKTHKESIEAFTKGNRMDLVEKESRELAILETFLPKEATDADIRNIVEDVVAKNPGQNFGPLMGMCMKAVSGKASGDRVTSILKSVLAQNQ